ncbi:hypothetical protein ACJMK2_013359 [Sinanodonta woodiana]|uniref:Gasdermin pore forming domain-containing protein n=2 Tax=Sinanodonta woodiana TaxID=1069815 RepID=A0ABD3UXA4_SINWO
MAFFFREDLYTLLSQDALSGSIMFSAACHQLVNSVGKDTLIPVPSLDEQDNVKPLQLVVMKKKRKFFFFTRCSYHPTEFQLTDVLQDTSPISVKVAEEVLSSDYQRTTKFSLKGKFGFDLVQDIMDVDLETSDTVAIQIKFGKVAKTEVDKPVLMQELMKRKLNLDHPFIKQVRKNKNKVLCLVTGVVHLTEEGHINRDTSLDTKAEASGKILHNLSTNAEVDVEKNRELGLANNTALAYNVNELNVSLEDGSLEMIMALGLHGGFKDSFAYDEVDTSVDLNKKDIDLQYPEEIFQAILDLPEKDRNELTSVILKMMSVPRDIQIFIKLVEKLESQKTQNINVQDLEKQLLTQKPSWLYLLELAGITVQASGELIVPREVTPLLTCFDVLFDALSGLEEEELDLIRKCAPETVPALFAALQAGLRNTKVTVSDVEPVLKDDKAIELLKQLGYNVSEQEILPPKDLPFTIDEVYWVMFALWGQKSK